MTPPLSDTLIPTIIIPSMNPVLRDLATSFIPKHWPLIVKDGNPLKHFAELKTLPITTRWAINVDEDCFLIDPQAILDLIAAMELGGYDMAGVQDGASNLRQHNPVIINPYFFVFDVAKVQAAPTLTGLDPAEESLKFRHLVRFTDAPHNYDGFEPYYPFFIDLLSAGLKPLFLHNVAYEAYQQHEYDLGKPSIVFGEDGRELAIHSWYSRLWHMPVVQERIRSCTDYAMRNPHCLRHADRAGAQELVLGIVTVQHNRGPQLRAWLAFHHAQGFRKFYFYADRCNDETWQVLLELAPEMDISVFAINDDIADLTLNVYQHACAHHLPQVDWMAFIDGDAYLSPVAARSMQQALAPYQDGAFSAIAVYAAADADGRADMVSLLRGKSQAAVTASSQLFVTERGTVDELLRPVTEPTAGADAPSRRHFQLSRNVPPPAA